VNGSAFACYALSLALRRAKQRPAALGASFAGYALVATAAFFGGELSFGMQLGARHTAAPIEPPADAVRVAAASDVPEHGVLRVDAAGIPLLLARTADGSVCAVSAICTHRGAPLDEGERDGDAIRCPWHGSRFALRDGAVVDGPATFPLASWRARIVDDSVEVSPFGAR